MRKIRYPSGHTIARSEDYLARLTCFSALKHQTKVSSALSLSVLVVVADFSAGKTECRIPGDRGTPRLVFLCSLSLSLWGVLCPFSRAQLHSWVLFFRSAKENNEHDVLQLVCTHRFCSRMVGVGPQPRGIIQLCALEKIKNATFWCATDQHMTTGD